MMAGSQAPDTLPARITCRFPRTSVYRRHLQNPRKIHGFFDLREKESRMLLVKLFPRDRCQQVLFLIFLVFFAGSCVKPPYLQFLLMQHVPTILAALLLGYLSNRFPISRLSFFAIILFLTLHTLGARYLYSYVPYDAWAQKLLGINITETFGFQRNHYDRLVHFSYGLL